MLDLKNEERCARRRSTKAVERKKEIIEYVEFRKQHGMYSPTKQRKCLKCDRSFLSVDSLRICPICSEVNQDY